MVQTVARIRRGNNDFEILVDLDEALKVRKGEGDISAAVLTDSVFHNLKSGEHAAQDVLEVEFQTGDFNEICEQIIKRGEVVLPTEYKNDQVEIKYKQVVDFISKNATSPEGRPYTPDRIMTALKEAKVVVKNKPIESQVKEILEQLQRIIPIKLEVKRMRLIIPAQYTGKAYGIVSNYKEEEEWLSNGDLSIIVKVPAGLVLDFFDKLNGVTHGASLSEELK
jgi:ribosome maturation protein SDO1